MEESGDKAPGTVPSENCAAVGDIIERYGFKPLWHKEVHKKHVKKYLKKLNAMAGKGNLQFVSGRGHRKEQLQKDIEDLRAALSKMKEYETQLHICGNRNSYSKTDHDAAFMHMKDDHIMNGQRKPAYNLQHAVNSGFIVDVGIFPNPTDVLTLKPFLEQMESNLPFHFTRLVADAGYESEENLKYLETKNIQAYIKPSNYEQIGTKKFEAQIGKKENMRYDAEKDCYICHNGKLMVKTKTARVKTASGYTREETHYLCRGKEKVLAESVLYAMAHNLGRLHCRIQNDKLDLHLYELKTDATGAA